MDGRGEDETGRSVARPSRAHETAAGPEAVEPGALVERLALVRGPTSAGDGETCSHNFHHAPIGGSGLHTCVCGVYAL